MKIVYSIFFVLSVLITNAQDRFTTNQGIPFSCEFVGIEYEREEGYNHLASHLYYKEAGDDSVYVIPIDSVQSFQHNGEVFDVVILSSLVNDYAEFFYVTKRLVDNGKLRLNQKLYTREIKEPVSIIQYKISTVFDLGEPTDVYFITVDDERYSLEIDGGNFKKEIKNLMSDCTQILERVRNKEYKFSDIEKLIRDYNKLMK